MSKEILEKAFQTTVEKEEKDQKTARAAMITGKVLGVTAALALDVTLVWLVLAYVIGFPITWTATLGWTFLVYLAAAKFKT